MLSHNAQKEFEKRIERSGILVTDLTPQQGFRLMFDFYSNTRAENCKFDKNGDMLLFQWGTHDWGDGRSFEYNITRQFIPRHSKEVEVDDVIAQLSFTFHFAPSAQLAAIKSGNLWCKTPDELTGLEIFIANSDAHRAIQTLQCSKITLDYGLVG